MVDKLILLNMRKTAVSTQRFAFILRLWNEAQDGQPNSKPNMRGSLQIANAEHTIYFSALNQIPSILEELADWSGPDGDIAVRSDK